MTESTGIPTVCEVDPFAPIYLIGVAGHPNFGDEVVTASWLRYLATVRPETDVWLDTPNPGTTSHLFLGLHPRLRTTNTMWRVVRDAGRMDPAEGDAYVDRVVTELGSPFYDLGLARARGAASVHLLGGGYLTKLWPEQLRMLRAVLALREVSGARVVATGHGLVPGADDPQTREAVAAFDHFSVRDRESAEATGAKLGLDDAFLGLDAFLGTGDIEASEDDVWVNLQSNQCDQAVFDKAVENVRALLGRPEFTGRRIRYVEGIPGIDRPAYSRLSDLIAPEDFLSFLRLWEGGLPVRPGQLWVTSRFHFHLLAAAAGAQGTAVVVHDEYYGVKHRSLLDAGTGWSVVSATAAGLPAPGAAEDFPSRVAELSRAKRQEAAALYPPLPLRMVGPRRVLERSRQLLFRVGAHRS
jgi:polysaccharide pyruvyl transferase WcaK-like protein